jgi:ribosomal protein S18 acetylase RimI-like enzyme
MIRTATADDLQLVRELWDAFAAEIPDWPWREEDSDEDFEDVERAIGEGGVFLAGNDGVAAGVIDGPRRGVVAILYVRPAARGAGVGRELVRAAVSHLAERGAESVELDVLESNPHARAFYERLGFATVERTMAVSVERFAANGGGPTFGAVHVQTDDAGAVKRNVEKVLPRLGRGSESSVSEAENGWVRVRSDVTDSDPAKLHALAKELSYASGGVTLALGVEVGEIVRYNLFDRGASVDEYASVPEYRGALPPGDVIALGANPTVVARLTGADPQRVREIARTAPSSAELPPAQELYEQIAELMGVNVD